MRVSLAIAALACAASGASGASLVYGQRYGGSGAGWYFGTGSSPTNRIADDFVLSSATNIVKAEFSGRRFLGGAMDPGMMFELSVWADEGAGLGVDDAGLIASETFAFSSLSSTVSGGVTTMTATFTTPIALAAGTKYWFSIGSDSSEDDYVWVTQGFSSPDPFGTPVIDADFGADGTWEGPYSVFPEEGLAFGLYGDSMVVPLPSAGALASIGLLSLGLRRRRVCGDWS